MTRRDKYSPGLRWRQLISRTAGTGIVAGAGVTILWLIFPRAYLTIVLVALVLLLLKLARDLYLCSLPIVIDESGIGIDAAPWLTNDPKQSLVCWSDIARVSEIPWSVGHLIIVPKQNSRTRSFKGEEILFTVPYHENFRAVLRRCLLLSPDLFFQSNKNAISTLVPRAALDRTQRRNLNKHLLELERMNAGVVMIWLGTNDHRSRDQVATMITEHQERLRAAALAELRGFDYQTNQRWVQARESYQQAFEIYREERELGHLASCARSLGKACIPLGKFREAREYLELALDLSRSAGSLRGEAECYNELSQIFMETGGPSARQEALNYLDKAQKLFRSLNDKIMEANAWGNKGMVYQSLAHLSERSDEMWWRKCRVDEHAARLRITYGMKVDEDTWLDCALACHRRALDLLRKEKSNEKRMQVAEARQLGCIAEVCWRKGRFEEAVKYYEEQKPFLERIDSGGFAQDFSAWGLSLLNVVYSNGKVVKPEGLDEGLRLLGKSIMGARAQSSQTEMILAYARRGQGFRKIRNYRAAYRDLSEAISIIEKIRPEAGPASARAVLLHEYQDVYGDLIETLLDLQSQEPNEKWRERAFAYCERAKCRRFLDIYLRAVTHNGVPNSPGSQSELEIAKRQASTGVEDDWDWLIEDATDGQELPAVLTMPFLSCDELLNQSISGPETLILQLFAREARSSHANPCEAMLAVIPATSDGLGEPIRYFGDTAEEIFEAATNLKKYIGTAPLKSVPFDPEESGALRLYEALIGAKQVARLLCSSEANRKIERIVIVPFGTIFNDVPFCALHDGRSFLVEQYEVIICPSLQWLSQIKVGERGYSKGSSKCLLLASTDCGLKGHADAIYRGLQSQLPDGVIRRDGRVEDNAVDAWKTLFESADEYNQIMIVAHGEQWPRPLLHFGDRSRAGNEHSGNWDVGLRDVYSFVRLDCDLLVMFACFAQQQSSPFRGEWESMASAFLAKGARAILAAQYSVHTWSTSILLHEMFKELRKGRSVASSLKTAQCSFIKKKHGNKYRHPYYWAMTGVGYAEQARSHIV